MFNVGELGAVISADDGKFKAAMKGVRQSGSAAAKQIEARFEQVGASMKNIGKNMSMSITAPLLAAGGYAVKTAADFEKMRVSLNTAFQGNERAAEAAFDQITEFAETTPFQMKEVMDSFIKLKNMGLDPSEEALESYGNTAAAMGKDLNQMIEAVADAAVGEFERLKEFGIRSESQGDKVKFTFRGVSTTVQKESDAIQKYLMNIGNTDFAGGMEKQSQTISGLLSTLKDSVSISMGKMGDSIIEALNLKTVIRNLTSRVAQIQKWFTGLSVESRKKIVLITAAIAGIGPALLAVGTTVTTFAAGFSAVFTALTSPITLVVGSIAGIVATTMWVADNIEAIGERIKREMKSWYISLTLMNKSTFQKIGTFFSQFLPGVLGQAAMINNEFIKTTQGLEKPKTDLTTFGETAKKAFDMAMSSMSDFAQKSLGIDFSGMFDSLEKADTNVGITAKVKGIKVFSQEDVETGNLLTTNMNALNEATRKHNELSTRDLELAQNRANAMTVLNDISTQFTDSFGQGMSNLIVQGGKFEDIMSNIGKLLASAAIQKGISLLLSGGLGGSGFFGKGGGIFGKIFGFAEGGRPPVGRASIVGEKGPELFVPDRAGTVIPNGGVGSFLNSSSPVMSGGGGTATQIIRIVGEFSQKTDKLIASFDKTRKIQARQY